jgi:predicted amidohydrolase YtcJ
MSPETVTREFLDQLIPDKPAFIEDETGGQTAWFNTKAMEALVDGYADPENSARPIVDAKGNVMYEQE